MMGEVFLSNWDKFGINDSDIENLSELYNPIFMEILELPGVYPPWRRSLADGIFPA